MAGYTKLPAQLGEEYTFHVGDPNVAERIRQANDNSRVIVLQLDGDELDAALWGLEHYKKPPFTVEELLDHTFGPQPPAQVKIEVSHARDCPCPIKDCYASPRLKRSVEI